MKKELQELLQAARIIQKYCGSNENCEGCPFDIYDDCELKRNYPFEWDIDDVKENSNE